MTSLPLLDTIELSLILLIVIALIVFAVIARRTQLDRDERDQNVQRGLARMEADHRYYLTAANLGPIHEKINDVARDVAELRAEQRAATEQLRVINRHLMKMS